MKTFTRKTVLVLAGLMMLAATGFTLQAQVDYNIEVCGIKINSSNYQDVTGDDIISGKVSYDPAHQILTLDNVTIETSKRGISAGNHMLLFENPLTIQLKGNNTINTTGDFSSIYFVCVQKFLQNGGMLRIKGPGNLTINSNGYGIKFNNRLYIENCTIDIHSEGSCFYGITSSVTHESNMEIINSKITSKSDEGGVIRNLVSGNDPDWQFFEMKDCAMTNPTLYFIKKHDYLRAYDGGPIIKEMTIDLPNMERYIDLQLADIGENDSITLRVASDGLKAVKILSGAHNSTIGSSTVYGAFRKYKASGGNMRIYGDINKLDVSYISSPNSKLKKIIPSHNKDLIELNCSFTGVTDIDLSGMSNLKTLIANKSALTSLDVSDCTSLEILGLINTGLTTKQLDDIFCQLPDRKGKTPGVVRILNSESTQTQINNAKATNSVNLKSKNWNLISYIGGNASELATTGNAVCTSIVYSVNLENAGNNRVDVISTVRDFLGLSLGDAKYLVEAQTPVIVAEGVSLSRAEAFKTKLETAGATVSLINEETNPVSFSQCDVMLENVGSDKGAVASLVNEVQALGGLAYAVKLVEAAPVILVKSMEKVKAVSYKEQLKAKGATVMLLNKKGESEDIDIDNYTHVNVQLVSVTNRSAVATVIREYTGLGLSQALALADAAPVVLAENMLKAKAIAFKNALEAAGATVKLLGPTGVQSLLEQGVRIQGGKGVITIELPGHFNKNNRLHIYNLQGQCVNSAELSSQHGSIALPAGIYILRLDGAAEKVVVR